MSDDTQYTYMPADGWYMTFPNNSGDHPRTFFRVAMWRIDPNNNHVVGMISLRLGPGQHESGPVRLHAPPQASDGQYVHVDDLDEKDRFQITRRRFA